MSKSEIFAAIEALQTQLDTLNRQIMANSGQLAATSSTLQKFMATKESRFADRSSSSSTKSQMDPPPPPPTPPPAPTTPTSHPQISVSPSPPQSFSITTALRRTQPSPQPLAASTILPRSEFQSTLSPTPSATPLLKPKSTEIPPPKQPPPPMLHPPPPPTPPPPIPPPPIEPPPPDAPPQPATPQPLPPLVPEPPPLSILSSQNTHPLSSPPTLSPSAAAPSSPITHVLVTYPPLLTAHTQPPLPPPKQPLSPMLLLPLPPPAPPPPHPPPNFIDLSHILLSMKMIPPPASPPTPTPTDQLAPSPLTTTAPLLLPKSVEFDGAATMGDISHHENMVGNTSSLHALSTPNKSRFLQLSKLICNLKEIQLGSEPPPSSPIISSNLLRAKGHDIVDQILEIHIWLTFKDKEPNSFLIVRPNMNGPNSVISAAQSYQVLKIDICPKFSVCEPTSILSGELLSSFSQLHLEDKVNVKEWGMIRPQPIYESPSEAKPS